MKHKAKRQRTREEKGDIVTDPATGSTSYQRTVTESENRSSSSGKSMSLPSVSGNAQVVLVLGVVLLLFAEYHTIVLPTYHLVWNGKMDKGESIDWHSSLGLIVFLVFMVFIASLNPEFGGLILVMMIGFGLVYVVEKGTGSLTALFKWFNTPAKTTGSSSSSSQGTTGSVPPTVK